ncbi:MAG: fumarylacetoacetate hydrolase family protein [Candidatus Helarchaeota archaeon]
MRIGRFQYEQDVFIGLVLKDQNVLSLDSIFPDIDPNTDNYIPILMDENNISILTSVLDEFDEEEHELLSVDDLKTLAPVVKPSKIVCLGLNYKDHAKETGMKLPKNPMLFSKASTAILNPYEAIVIPPNSKTVDYEVELAVVIGTKCRSVDTEDALDHVFGYTILNDVSERIIQRKDGQFFRAKSFDTFAPIGPWIETNIEDPNNLKIQLRLNNELKQDSNTSEMAFNVPQIISFISDAMTLLPGDVIGTGTPAGVGLVQRTFLKSGDKVELTIEKIGTLINKVK